MSEYEKKEEDKKNLEIKMKDMETKIDKYENERNIHSLSYPDFYSGILSILGSFPNKERAIRKLIRSSDKGNSDASLILGILYEAEKLPKRNIEESIMYYTKAGEQGNPSGFNRIGIIYYNRKCYSKALEYYQKAYDLGDPFAANNIGYMHEKNQNYDEALKYYQKAAEFNQSSAINHIGELYQNGHIEKKPNYKLAFDYFIRAAQLDDPNALFNLGVFYDNGYGVVEPDSKKASGYYDQAKQLGCIKKK